MKRMLFPKGAGHMHSLPGLLFMIIVAGCAGSESGSQSRSFTFPIPYRIDVRQGNWVESSQVNRLKIGMKRDEVRYILGTPLIRDVFHPQRWDYLYRMRSGRDGAVEKYRLTVYFEDDLLSRIQKGSVPQSETPILK